MITSPPPKNIEVPSPEVKVTITKEQLKKVINAASQLQLPEVVVRSKDGQTITLTATDIKNPTSNEFSVDIGESTGATFTFVFKTENLKMVIADYDVEISSKGISSFKSPSIQYWIAIEASSSYKKG
jgi:hypothetical protein